MSNENYRHDGDPRALYYSDYRDRFNAVSEKIQFGQIIPFKTSVLFVGKNELLPTSFDLRNVDKQSVNGFTLPGKSAHIAFSDKLDIVCGALFDRKPRSVDHLYVVGADEIMELDFYPYYLPLPNLPLHLRLVHITQQRDNTIRDIPYSARVALSSLLSSHKVI